MDRDRPKLSYGIGSRTGKNVLLNKNIRKLANGKDNFEDYFTDSSEGSTSTSFSYSSVSQSAGTSTRNPTAVDKENIQGVDYSSPIESQLPRIVIGSRSKKNILPPKNIRKHSNGKEIFEDYFTDDGSDQTTIMSTESLPPMPSPQVSSISINSSKKVARPIRHSSPITRLTSSKPVCNDADNSSDSDSEEEINPPGSKSFTNKINKSKESSRKSIHEKHDSCDAKLLKLAEDYEKSKHLSDYDLQLHTTIEAKSNKSEVSKTSQRTESKSLMRKDVSNVENPHLTRSRSHQGTPTKSQSQNTDKFLVKTTEKNISSKKDYFEQNVSKASHSIALESELQRSKSKQSHFDFNAAQDFDESDVENPVPEQDGTLLQNKSSVNELPAKRKLHPTPNNASKLRERRNSSNTPNTASQLPVKRKSNLTPDVASKLSMKRKLNVTPSTATKLLIKRKSNLTPNTISKLPVKRKSKLTPNIVGKRKSSSFVTSSMHNENVQAPKDLPDNCLNATFEVDDPQCLPLSNAKNSNDRDSQLHEKKKIDSNPSEMREISQKIGSISPKKTIPFVFPEEQHCLISSLIESFIENQSGNMDDMLEKTTVKNIPKQKQFSSPNTAQDSAESSTEDGVVERERTSYGRKHVGRKSDLTVSARTKKTNMSVASDVNTAQDSLESSEEDGVVEKEKIPHGQKFVPMESDLTPIIASKKKTKLSVPSDVNTYQDSLESSEVDCAVKKKRTSYSKKKIARKSDFTPFTASKKKTVSSVAPDVDTAQDSEESSGEEELEQERSFREKDVAKKSKPMPANKHKHKMSSSLNLSRNVNKTSLNEQNVDGLPNNVLNATFDIINEESPLSDNEETNMNKASFQVNTEAHEENNKKNQQTGKQKRKDKSHKKTETKKDKKSSVAQENETEAYFRRSSRKRIPPLESWRNERACYRLENGSLHLIDIDPGNKKDDSSQKAIIAKLQSVKNKKELNKKSERAPKFQFKDLILEKKVTLPLLKRFRLIPWEEQPGEKRSYNIKRVVQTPNSNFGFIEINSGKSKPLQYLPNEDVYLCLMQGKIKALIGEKEVALEEKDTLVVPRSVPYTLINNGQRKALLSFSVGRYKYLENMVF